MIAGTVSMSTSSTSCELTSCSFRCAGSGYSAAEPVARHLPARGERAGILR